jgi:hypothetical protein
MTPWGERNLKEKKDSLESSPSTTTMWVSRAEDEEKEE